MTTRPLAIVSHNSAKYFTIAHVWCDKIFSDDVIANLLSSLAVKEFRTLAGIWQEYSVVFSTHREFHYKQTSDSSRECTVCSL